MMCMFLAACGSFGSLAPYPLTFSPTKIFFAFFATGEDMFDLTCGDSLTLLPWKMRVVLVGEQKKRGAEEFSTTPPDTCGCGAPVRGAGARDRTEPERARESLCAAEEGRSRTMVSGSYSSRVPLLIAATTQLAVRVPSAIVADPLRPRFVN